MNTVNETCPLPAALQIKGDPSVRRFLFEQERVASDLDRHLDEVLDNVAGLIKEHGVFHAKIHFASGQITLWLIDDPFRYRVHLKDDFVSGAKVLAVYPRLFYPSLAIVPQDAVDQVLAEFKRLRNLDRNIYLRSGSLNVISGNVGLNFSCDGTHYMTYRDFLARGRELFG